MTENLKQNVTRGSIWLRLIFMIVFAVAFNVAEFVILVIVVFQFLASLFTREPNDRLTRFGRTMALYVQQVIEFLTFATEEKPFPFSPWPEEPIRKAGAKQTASARDKDAQDTEAQNQITKSATTKKRTTRKSPTGPKTRKRSS